MWRGVPYKTSGVTTGDSIEGERDSVHLQTAGSKFIQVIVGDGGTEVNQELHLSIQGEAVPGVFIDALLSDVGRDAGEERTATLEEVDEVHFRVETSKAFLHLGNMTWKEQELGLSGLERSTLGAAAGLKLGHSEIRGAGGYDELERITTTFTGVDGQQKGYLLATGASDTYMSVVPRSETVFLNGVELTRDEDYTVNYAGGVLDFNGALIPGSQDEIRVEFDAYNSGGLQILKAADGKYRGRNVWLDVVGFELSSDTARLRRGTWTDSDYQMLKVDTGGTFDRSDTLDELVRPWALFRLGTRARMQSGERFYADGEMDYSDADTNTLSSMVGGPHGRAYRWFLSSDSTNNQRFSLFRLNAAGDYMQSGYFQPAYQGSEKNWDSYVLRHEWDLDSSGLDGSLRYDLLSARFRLPHSYFVGAEWGYRRSLSDGENWNSSRSRIFAEHKGNEAQSSFSLVRVSSFETIGMERYQGLASASYVTGVFRPFGSGDYGIWLKDADSLLNNRSDMANGKSGFDVIGQNWNLRETIFGSRGRTGRSLEKLEDSLKISGWEQSASYSNDWFSLTHLLQYKRTFVDTAGTSNSWLSEENLDWGRSGSPFVGKASYSLGLTREVPYVAIYKAVTKGTGDVMYDSLTGVFVEGVDNGDYVYEGMGRSDSADPVRASSAQITCNFSFIPRALGIEQGVLRDVAFSFDGSSEGRDTTGNTLFLPPFMRSTLHEISSGLFTGEASVLWTHPQNAGTLEYKIGTESEKRNTSQGYFQNRLWHTLDAIYTGRERETWEAEPGIEYVALDAAQVMNWKIYEVKISWKRELPLNLYVKPAGWVRKGLGKDESERLEAFLRQASFTLGFDNEKNARAFDTFGVTDVTSDNETLPYQMASGFDKGITYRNELSASVDANEYLTLSLNYIVRFGSAEGRIFQKMSMEAKAFF